MRDIGQEKQSEVKWQAWRGIQPSKISDNVGMEPLQFLSIR